MNQQTILMQSLGSKPRKGVVKQCPFCNNLFYCKPSRISKSVYCSTVCMHTASRNRKVLNCKICGTQYERPISQILHRGSSCCSYECAYVATGQRFSKEKNPGWKGGISRYYKFGYHNKAYNKWKSDVLERDNYQCQFCGESKNLVAHHILRFAYHISQRINVNNGLTLCEKCHNGTKKYDRLSKLVILEK